MNSVVAEECNYAFDIEISWNKSFDTNDCQFSFIRMDTLELFQNRLLLIGNNMKELDRKFVWMCRKFPDGFIYKVHSVDLRCTKIELVETSVNELRFMKMIALAKKSEAMTQTTEK